jgi:hypothetical protein
VFSVGNLWIDAVTKNRSAFLAKAAEEYLGKCKNYERIRYNRLVLKPEYMV